MRGLLWKAVRSPRNLIRFVWTPLPDISLSPVIGYFIRPENGDPRGYFIREDRSFLCLAKVGKWNLGVDWREMKNNFLGLGSVPKRVKAGKNGWHEWNKDPNRNHFSLEKRNARCKGIFCMAGRRSSGENGGRWGNECRRGCGRRLFP